MSNADLVMSIRSRCLTFGDVRFRCYRLMVVLAGGVDGLPNVECQLGYVQWSKMPMFGDVRFQCIVSWLSRKEKLCDCVLAGGFYGFFNVECRLGCVQLSKALTFGG